jgi:molybdenum cofactor guanylyltransferase
MIGVILCGGKSSRMGDDKGLLITEQKPWAQLAKDKLSKLKVETVLSIRSSQFNQYVSFFSEHQLIIDNQELDIAGPLLGALSVHICFPNEDVFLLACDLIKMDEEVLTEVLSHYKQRGSEEAFVYKFGEQVEPLCGIYTATGLAKILALQRSHGLRRHSMKSALDQLHSVCLNAEKSWEAYFKNYNSPADLSL